MPPGLKTMPPGFHLDAPSTISIFLSFSHFLIFDYGRIFQSVNTFEDAPQRHSDHLPLVIGVIEVKTLRNYFQLRKNYLCNISVHRTLACTINHRTARICAPNNRPQTNDRHNK